jgi:hypothetical protein
VESDLLSEEHKKLLAAKRLTQMTGAISDSQKFQIEQYLKVAFPGFKRIEASFYVNEQGQRDLFFSIFTDPEKSKLEKLQKRCKILVDNLRWLLGDSWNMEFKVDNKVVHQVSGTKEMNYDGNLEDKPKAKKSTSVRRKKPNRKSNRKSKR